MNNWRDKNTTTSKCFNYILQFLLCQVKSLKTDTVKHEFYNKVINNAITWENGYQSNY